MAWNAELFKANKDVSIARFGFPVTISPATTACWPKTQQRKKKEILLEFFPLVFSV